MDIKHVHATAGHYPYHFILVMLCEISNYMIVEPLHTVQTPEICKAIRCGFIQYFGPPTHVMCEQDPAFMSSLSQYFMAHFGIKVITVSTTNHKSLLAEHGIKSLANILKKHLGEYGTIWMEYLDFAMLVYNSFCTPNLAGLSLLQYILGCSANIIPLQDVKPDSPLTGSHRKCYIKLCLQLGYLRKHLQQFRDKRHDMLNKDREHQGFYKGQIVYMYLPSGAITQTGSRKIRCTFVGPLVIYKTVSPNQFLLMSIDGTVYPRLVEETRLKPGYIRTPIGNVNNLKRAMLKNMLPSAPTDNAAPINID